MIQVMSDYVPREHFLMLVSGGVDSIAAAHWLKHKYRKEFTIVHFNHHVQPANRHMMEKVQQFAYSNDLQVRCFERPPDIGVSEKDLREWRLECIRTYFENASVVTAHHLNDAVENYINNMLKGTPEYVPIQEVTSFDTFSIYHPFLITKKKDFAEYIEREGLSKYIEEDQSNLDLSLNRNWIRHKLAQEIYDRNVGIEKVVYKKFYL